MSFQFRVTLEFLEKFNQPLRDKVWDMLIDKKLTPSNVAFILVDCEANYHDASMTELQHYVQTDEYRHAWQMEDMKRQHPQPEPLSGFAALMKATLQQHS